MTKKLKTSKLYKGAILGTAGLMCLSFTPVNALNNAFADYYGGANSIGSEVISINGANDSVSVGGNYKVMKAYFGTENKIELGLSDEKYDTELDAGGAYENLTGKDGLEIVDITSNVSVTYSSGIAVTLNNSTEPEVYKVFTADYVGGYTVSYSITITYEDDSSKTYSTELAVKTESSSAYMMFEDESFIMPTTYYKDLAKKNNNNQLLPIRVMVPNVYIDDEKEPVEFADEEILTSKDDVVGKAIVVTASNGIDIDKTDDGKLYIKASDIASAVNGNNIVLTYTYYNAGSFVMSTNKTITIYDEYESEYKLSPSLASTFTATTKDPVKLPTVNAYSSEKNRDNKKASERVDVITQVTVTKKNSSGYYTEEKAGAIVDGKFTAWADGDYKFVFKVTDFYGNEAEVKTTVSGVKDTKSPVVTMYDASDAQNDRDAGTFVSAETKLKSSAVQKNIVVYAIGATDNVSGDNDIKYQRTIKSSSRTIEIKSYNQYNLIFDFHFETFLEQNYAIRKQITADFASDVTKDLNNAEDVKAWLKEHDYLIVTSTKQDDYTDADYIAEGYAYLNVNYPTMISGSSSGISYDVTYIATDASGNNSSIYYSFKVFDNAEHFTDATAPTISINSTFKNNYSSSDKIVFSAPEIKDDSDNYIEKEISYAYYNGTTKIDDKDFTFTDDNYTINIKKDIATFSPSAPDAERIVLTIKAVDDYGNGESETFEKEFKIIDILDSVAPEIVRQNYNTAKAGTTQNEEIQLPTIVYTDDYAGYMTSEVRVYHVESDSKRTLINTNGKKASAKDNFYTLNAGSFVASFAGEYEAIVTTKDKGGNVVVSYYHYDVDAKNEVNRPYINSSLSRETKVETDEELLLPIPVVNYTIDDDFEIYGVSDDSTNSATNYEVLVKYANADYDLLNNEIFVGHSYFQTGKYQLAYEINLQIFRQGFGFTKAQDGVTITIGPDTYYVTRVKAQLSDADEHTGDYILYSKNANGTIKNVIYGEVSGTSVTFYDLATKLDGQAYITVGGDNYYATITDEGLEFVSNYNDATNYVSAKVEDGKLKFTSHGNLPAVAEQNLTVTVDIVNGESQALTTKDFVEITQTTDTYTITVSDTVAPTLNGANYEYNPTAEKGAKIYIQPNKSVETSSYFGAGIDEEKSYVEVAFKGRTKNEDTGATSSYSRTDTVKLKDWTNPANSAFPGTYVTEGDNAGSIEYELSATNNGTYTISYYIFDKAGNQQSLVENETKFEIKVGDTVSPTLKLANEFLKDSYKVGDTITLDMSKITMSDNVTTDKNDLMKTLKITLKNTTTNEEVENLQDGIVEISGKYEGFFEYKITEVGTYKIEVEVTDDAGLSTTKSIEFEVTSSETDAKVVSTAIGIVLVVVAVAILAGVIIYFVVSKVKLDKELGNKKKK